MSPGAQPRKPLRVAMPCRVLSVGRTGYKIDQDGRVNEERCWWIQIALDPDDPAENMRLVLRSDLTEGIAPDLVAGDTIELHVVVPVREESDAQS